jgi:hypothetical protein
MKKQKENEARKRREPQDKYMGSDILGTEGPASGGPLYGTKRRSTAVDAEYTPACKLRLQNYRVIALHSRNPSYSLSSFSLTSSRVPFTPSHPS